MTKGTDVLADYDDVFRKCRDLRHAYDYVGSPWRDGGDIKRRVICLRCGSEGVDTWRPAGKRAKPRRYEYVEGYIIPSSEGKVTMPDVRISVMEKMTVYASEEDMHKALFEKPEPKTRSRK